MKTIKSILLTLAGIVASMMTANAQQLDLGSNGSYGPLSFTKTGIYNVVIPPDGVFHCTTVTIGAGVTLKFVKNSTNTPVYLLATGDITIDGTIDISGGANVGSAPGIGGPGGFDGGAGGELPGDGSGPGGGKGGYTQAGYGGNPTNLPLRGSGSFGTRSTDLGQSTTAGPTYGNALLIPLLGGSGGGGGSVDNVNSIYRYGGGGGGGAILIASNTKISFDTANTTNPVIDASGGHGGTNTAGNGSGGSVRLVSPKIEGHSRIYIYPYSTNGVYGGFGRIRIDSSSHDLFSLYDDGTSSKNTTYGTTLVTFPANAPSLRVSQVGTQSIPADRMDAVYVLFPTGSAATQPVKVKATKFNSVVPLRVVVTPETGDRAVYDFSINNTGADTTEGSIDVSIPAGVTSRIDVWSLSR